MSAVKVEKSGMMTTVQDQGRRGFQQFGISESGAMDPWALRWANFLVGNEENAAGIEVTLMGPQLLFEQDAVIAVGGADLSVKLDQTPIPRWTSIHVRAGQRLSFGKPRFGVRAYVAVQGGIDVPVALGSRATFIKAKLGGFRGRELRNGDVLPVGECKTQVLRRRLHPALLPDYDLDEPLRVIPGPDLEMFSEEALSTFFGEVYSLTNEVDRMGYRLNGPPLPLASNSSMLSDAVAMGTIQIPSSGFPLLLLADRQTSGGYARIGTVIHEDLPKTAQLGPHAAVSFSRVTLEEAQQLRRKREYQYRWMKQIHRM